MLMAAGSSAPLGDGDGDGDASGASGDAEAALPLALSGTAVASLPRTSALRATPLRGRRRADGSGDAASFVDADLPDHDVGWGGDRDLRCLSIQSHVVDGYVGNKCAVFPLQVHGFDVSPINSVHFSNHTGYGSWKGTVLEGEQLLEVFEGLRSNGLAKYTHVLTGYMRSASFLKAVAASVRRLREDNPGTDVVYVCDPVMGDHGRLYVPDELVGIYREEIVPLATILTPNQFEAEQLSGIDIRNVKDCFRACDALHAKGVRSVVVTSATVGGGGDDTITLLASTPWSSVRCSDMFAADAAAGGAETDAATGSAQKAGSGTGSRPQFARFMIDMPKLPQYFTGTGDLLAALLLAWTERLEDDMVGAVERAVASVQAVLRNTVAKGDKRGELRLIQSRRELEAPAVTLRATAWTGRTSLASTGAGSAGVAAAGAS